MTHFGLVTPKSWKIVILVAAFLFVTAPLIVARYYFVELKNGSFPIEADSIGIPISRFLIALFVTAPLSWGVVWLAIRRYPGSVSLSVWNEDRPLWSFMWTFSIGVVALMFLIAVPWLDGLNHPLLVIHVLGDVYFLIVLSSGLVAQGA